MWLHQAAGEANESQGQLDEAISQYRQVLALAPKRPGIHFRLGRVLLAQAAQAKGNPATEAEALKEFGLELQIDPTNADAAYEIGEMMRKAWSARQGRRVVQAGGRFIPRFRGGAGRARPYSGRGR